MESLTSKIQELEAQLHKVKEDNQKYRQYHFKENLFSFLLEQFANVTKPNLNISCTEHCQKSRSSSRNTSDIRGFRIN